MVGRVVGDPDGCEEGIFVVFIVGILEGCLVGFDDDL